MSGYRIVGLHTQISNEVRVTVDRLYMGIPLCARWPPKPAATLPESTEAETACSDLRAGYGSTGPSTKTVSAANSSKHKLAVRPSVRVR